MSALRRLWQRVLAQGRRDTLDDEFDDEAQSHLELAADEYVQRGYTRAEAERIARARFGLVGASRDAHREARGLGWVDAGVFDVVQGLRSLRHAPAFSLIAIATLTIAIALNVTVFVVMDAVLFRGYPLVERNDRILYMQERGPGGEGRLSYADVEEWHRQGASFVDFAFVRGRAILFRDGEGRSSDMRIWEVSANTFGVLGVRPFLGRDFVESDQQPGAPQVVLLNHRFWRSRFRARPDVVGTTIRVNDSAATVIGVMPERFDFPLRIDGDFWMPVTDTPALRRRGVDGGFVAVGLLKDGVRKSDAEAELETINRRLELDYPDTNRGVVPTVLSHAHLNSGPDAALIWGSLFAASWFVLIIACANLANLTLVRTIGRGRELMTKLALGAGPGRVMRQLVIESVVLAVAAGVVSWAIVHWAVSAWDAITFSMYQVIDYSVDVTAAGYLAGITVLAALLVSSLPVVRVYSVSAGDSLKGGARGDTRAGTARLSRGLIAMQVAFAVVLLAGAGVLVRSFTAIVGASTGVRGPERVLSGLMRMPSVDYGTPEIRQRYLERLEASLQAVAGVQHVAIASTIPVRFAQARPIDIDGRVLGEDDESIGFVRASADYFSVLGVAPIAGRVFRADDSSSASPVAVVNESFVERFWPGRNPIGRRIRVRNPAGPDPWRVVVGVVPNILQSDPLRQTFKPLVYVPVRQEPPPLAAYWMARTAVGPDAVAGALRTAAEGVDPAVAVSNVRTLEASFAFDRDFMDVEHSELGKHAKVAPLFAGVALLLSAMGLIAVVTHSVSQRTKEIGIRMAIGATTGDIRRMVTREGMSPVAFGAAIGIAGSLAINQLLRSQLVGVSPTDPVVLTAAPLVLIVVTIVASQLPARRAAAVNPVVALRTE